MTEKDFYAPVTKYYIKNAIKSGIVELKFTRTNRIPFDCLPPHQEENMLRAESSFGYKIPDSGLTKKPGDIIIIKNGYSPFIAIYYKPRMTEIYEIPIRDFLKEKYAGKEKSLTKERASQIGRRIII